MKYELNRDHSSVKDDQSHCEFQILEVGQKADACADGLLGQFIPVMHDFKMNFDGAGTFYRDDLNWGREKRERVRKFRFVIAFLGLVALSLSQMARLILHIGISEMVVKKGHDVTSGQITTTPIYEISLAESEITTQGLFPGDENMTTISDIGFSTQTASDTTERFDWSSKQKNLLLASFYMGYMPSMLMSGNPADRYGSKWFLLVCVSGSALINLVTPAVARYSYYMLVGLRIMLGLLQGVMIPAAYDLFNRWLTLSESSIFVPLIKVLMALGSCTGALLPGMISSLGLQWPVMFYLGIVPSTLWTVAWLSLATSSPHDNSFVKPPELQKILKKKGGQKEVERIATISAREVEPTKVKKSKNETPWFKIITSPTVLALTFTKLTYNIGVDLIYLQFPLYLPAVHNTTTAQVSTILSCGLLMQGLFTTFFGLLAKMAVDRKAFGLSTTKWRKILQGSSNIGMAIPLLLIPILNADLNTVVILVFLGFFAYMIGAGGESMVPYDITYKYPATIMGFAHSISILDGILIPLMGTIVVGDNENDPSRWNQLFTIFGIVLILGGLTFITFVKAKPFLPEEVENKRIVCKA